MANIERLFAQRSHVEAEVKKIHERISDGGTNASSVRLKSYEIKLQCHYQEYERVYSELLSVLSAERFDDLEEDFSHFEDTHNNACALVKNLLLSVPTASGTGNYNRWTTFNSFTAPRWNTPPIRSQTPKPMTEQPVPIPAVNETPRTSLPNEIKVSTIITNPTQIEKPPHDEATKNTIPIRGFVEIRNPPTSEKDSRVGNEPTEFVNSKTEESKPMTIPMLTGLGPVLMPFHPPPGFHPTPKQNPMPTGMPPVSHYSTGSQPVSQPLQSTTGSLPVFHPLQCKNDTLPTWKQSRCVTGSCPVPQIPYVAESVPTPTLPTAMTGFRPVQDQYPCAVESHPKRPDVAGIPPVLKPFLSTVEASPVTTPALMSIGANPVKKSTTTSFDARSATKPTMMSAGSLPVGKTISPSAGTSPVDNSAPMAVGSHPMVKPTPMSVGTSPACSSAQRSAGTSPVVMPIPMSTGTSPVGSSDQRFTDASSVINYAYVSAGSPPVTKIISPSAGASPVGSSAPTAVGSRPMVKPTPMSAGNSPVGIFVQRSTGASPVVEPIPMSTGNDSVGNYALSPMVMPILTSTGAHPMVDSVPMSVGPFPAAKPTLTHIEANPPGQKFTRTSSVVKPTAIPTRVNPEAKPFNDSVGLCPVAKPSPKPTDLRPVTQSNPMSSSTVAVISKTNRTSPTAGIRPARKRVRSRTNQVQIPKTTETRPATKRALMSSGIRPVLEKPPKKLWIVVVLKFDQPPLDPPPVNSTGAFEYLHSDTWPRKPPDSPKQIRPSEAFVERVSRTRPLNEPTQRLASILPPILAGEYVHANAKEYPRIFCP
ncbi:mucin-2-like [Aedes albopictus]|uniref:Uncharacterized protein n=1 Tax=Aedes albopictus TaxID=7160 RepID=A0ABM1XJ31_AEDAL